SGAEPVIIETEEEEGFRLKIERLKEKITSRTKLLILNSPSNPTSFCQKASIVALEGSQEPLRGMVSEFAQRREYIVERLNSITGISCLKPEGAFYVFPNISKLLGKSYKPSPCAQRLGKSQIIKDSINLSQILLEDAKIAVVPGLAFGKDHYLRLSYATSMENITKGMDRLEKFVKKL
ncbi:aminotransferase class I/II-fold pyridoxal phosphate-dependent enzyme, partial [bacterium]|nr:aminotransferase class I/II-fold pyridoxal phosphate-dependent enzyme [bacterium]MCG2675813.1 aminotransferase class I/II-fold pyridoxal phosphate-dependent enzyme [bacterium]